MRGIVTAALAALVIGACTSGSAAVEEAPPAPGIPPGQEDLLLAMLGKGAQLPDGCKLGDGRVEYTFAEVGYACRFGEVVVELTHASQARAGDTETEYFAIAVIDGSPPESFTDWLAQRVYDREEDFEWLMPEAARETAKP